MNCDTYRRTHEQDRLVGNLTHDPEIRSTQSGVAVCGRSDPTRGRLAEYVAELAELDELDELEREMTGEMVTLEKQLVTVDAELARLPENQEKILRLRYCDGERWREVAKSTNYYRYCREISATLKQKYK